MAFQNYVNLALNVCNLDFKMSLKPFLINKFPYLVSESMERFNAFLILSAEGAELINPIDGQPRPDPSFHHNLANPSSF